MRRTHILAALLIAAVLLPGVGPSAAQSTDGAGDLAPPPPAGTVYVFRPMGGKLATPEMDNLAGMIRGRGLDAEVFNYTNWIRPAKNAVAHYKSEAEKSPIIVVGHSAGGDSAIRFAQWLKLSGVPVDLIVTLDPTRIARRVPGNVERFVNVHSSVNALGGGDPKPAQDFRGHFASVDLKDHAVLHRYLPGIAGLQEAVVDKIAAVAARPTAARAPVLRIEYPIPQGEPFVLFDSGVSVRAEEGDTAASIAAQYGVPVWVVVAMNGAINPGRPLTPGQKLTVPLSLEVGLPGDDGRPTP